MILPEYPFRVEFEVISVCNLNCSYCYAKPFSHEIPSLNKLEYLFRKTKDEAHPFQVIILGGEPFLRKDIIDLLQLAGEIFRRIGVSTNGTLLSKLNETDAKALKELTYKGVLSIQVR